MKHLWKYFTPLIIIFSLASTAQADDEAFLIGWYLYDDPNVYETVSSPDHVVDHHGDPDLYFYEPSISDMCQKGSSVRGRGLIDQVPPDNEIGFCVIEQYILENAGNESGNISLESVFTYEANTTLATFDEATYTYAMVYLYIPDNLDPALFSLKVHEVDDGIEVLVNSYITGFMKLHEDDVEFDLDTAMGGATGVLQHGFNTVILILVDDSRIWKYIRNVEFLYDGQPGPVVILDPNIVYGRVFDSYTLEPIAGATVTLEAQPQTSDDTGYYYYNGLADGTYAISAEAEGYEPASISISVADASAFYQPFYLDILEEEDGDAEADPEPDLDDVPGDMDIEFVDLEDDDADLSDVEDDADNDSIDDIDTDDRDANDVSPDGLIDQDTGDAEISDNTESDSAEDSDTPDAIDNADGDTTPPIPGIGVGAVTGTGCNCRQGGATELLLLLGALLLWRRKMRKVAFLAKQ